MTMNRIWMTLFLGATAWLTVNFGSALAHAQDLIELRVTVQYDGSGPVNEQHGIHLFFFDSPDFASGDPNVIPIAMRTVYSNGQTVVLAGLRQETVYLVAAYNEDGSYDTPMGPPPSGTPVAIYRADDPAAPTPIALKGEPTVAIDFTFDDSDRMP